MPDDETTKDEETQDENKEESTPEYAKADELASLRNQLAGLKELLGDRLSAAPAPAQPAAPVAAPTIEDVSDDDLDGSLSQGTPVAKKLRTAMKAEVAREVQTLRAEIAALRNFGVTSIGAIGERIAEADMPFKKHAKLGPIIKAEIENYAKVEPAIRTNPQVLKAIHDRVVGEHLDEITQERTEAAIRKARDEGGGSLPTGANGRGKRTDVPEVPTVEDLLGTEAAIALRERGQDADTFSRRLGYKDWAAYAEVIKKQQTPEGAH
jgi:hypothetical protein